ncbi:hypothetical protein OEZ85_014391 [Tetradesmus obliquus]|uniref:Uncharacterized protein n=1 Tax=Tetradesmus obliquus TaxID=3088 RepID=A0ABY8U864_TETOB|nr:hypothetical protein OEZ85_014391 [Tetradesmus obliquus]
MAVKELSGILSDPGKWEATFAALASVESDVETLRIYHNTPLQLQSACRVLSCNSSVRTLDIGDAAAEGAIALGELLKASTSLCCLKVQSFDRQADASSAAAVIRGLACNSSLQELCLQGLTDAAVKDLAGCIAAGPLAGKLQLLRLPCCRLDLTAAGALHDALLGTPSLQLLSLQKAVLDSNSSSTLPSLFSPALAAHPALAKLELQQITGLQQHDWHQLGAYVAQAPFLQELLLQEAPIGPGNKLKGAEGLAGLLCSPAGQNLSTLNLANNCFAEQELDSVAAAAAAAATAAAAAGQVSGMDPALVESLSGWLLEAAGAGNVVLPAELLKSAGGGGSDSGSRWGKRAVRPAVAAAAQLGGSSEDGSSSEAGQNVGRLRVRCVGRGSNSRDGGACSPRFFSCSDGSECGSESGCESESESGAGGEHGRDCNGSRAASPGAAARCAVRKLDSPRSSVVVAKAAAAAAAGGSKRLSRFAAAAQQETGVEVAPRASGATQPLL